MTEATDEKENAIVAEIARKKKEKEDEEKKEVNFLHQFALTGQVFSIVDPETNQAFDALFAAVYTHVVSAVGILLSFGKHELRLNSHFSEAGKIYAEVGKLKLVSGNNGMVFGTVALIGKSDKYGTNPADSVLVALAKLVIDAKFTKLFTPLDTGHPEADIWCRKAVGKAYHKGQEENLKGWVQHAASDEKNDLNAYVAYIDANGFKAINDDSDSGHALGDACGAALGIAVNLGMNEVQTAAYVKEYAVCRTGGDEYRIYFTSAKGKNIVDTAKAMEQYINNALSSEIEELLMTFNHVRWDKTVNNDVGAFTAGHQFDRDWKQIKQMSISLCIGSLKNTRITHAMLEGGVQFSKAERRLEQGEVAFDPRSKHVYVTILDDPGIEKVEDFMRMSSDIEKLEEGASAVTKRRNNLVKPQKNAGTAESNS